MRIPKLFNIDADVIAALVKRSEETGDPMSRIVEHGVRLALALPVPEREAPAPVGLPQTRTEKEMLAALAANPVEPLCGRLWAEKIGCSRKIAEKALIQLTLQGKAFYWGPNHVDYQGIVLGGCWGGREPLALFRNLVDSAKAKIEERKAAGQEWFNAIVIDTLSRYMRPWGLMCGDNVQAVRVLACELMGVPADDVAEYATYEHTWIENYAEREIRQAAEYKVKKAESDAKIRERIAAEHAYYKSAEY